MKKVPKYKQIIQEWVNKDAFDIYEYAQTRVKNANIDQKDKIDKFKSIISKCLYKEPTTLKPKIFSITTPLGNKLNIEIHGKQYKRSRWRRYNFIDKIYLNITK